MIKIFGHLACIQNINIHVIRGIRKRRLYGNARAIGRKALLHWLNNPTKAFVNDLFITPIMFGLLAMVGMRVWRLTHPDITPIVNFIEITRKSSLIAYLHAQLVSQSVSFMMTRGLRIIYRYLIKCSRYTYPRTLEIITSARIIVNRSFDHRKKKKKTISGLKRVSFSASDKFSSDNFQISFFKPVYLFLLDEKDQLSYLTVYIITFTFFSDSRIYEIIL